MICRKCGNEIPENARFCRECGTEVVLETEALDGEIRCPKCGDRLEEGALFCNNCGFKIENNSVSFSACPKCGKKLKPNAQFCGECGTVIDNKKDKLVQNSKRKKKDKGLIALIVILAAVIIACISVVMILYLNNNSVDIVNPDIVNEVSIDDEDTLEEQTSEIQTPNPSSKQDTDESKEETESISNTNSQGNSSVVVDSRGYATYTNTAYSFKCKYPSWFRVESDTDTLFTCTSADGLGGMNISCTDDYGNSVQESLNSYISSFAGTVDYKASGDDYFAVRIKQNSNYHYRYAKFKDGRIYIFSFVFPQAQFETYDDMINEIYADFIKQF